MKPKLEKIVCPLSKNHREKGKPFKTILMIFSRKGNESPKKFWIHCPWRKCGRWIEIRFNNAGGVTCEEMPKNVSFDVEEIPTVVIEDHNERT